MQSEMWDLDLSNLGDEGETVRVIVGNGMQPNYVAPAPAAVDQHLGPTSPLPESRVVDTEWEEFQRFKAMRAAKEGANGVTTQQSNSPIGLPTTRRVIVDETPEMPPTGYPVGHNGKVYLIQPNVEVDLPIYVLEILQNAVKSTPVIDEKTRKIVRWHNTPRIPWRHAA